MLVRAAKMVKVNRIVTRSLFKFPPQVVLSLSAGYATAAGPRVIIRYSRYPAKLT